MVAVSALIPPTAAFTRVGALTLNTGENDVTSAVLDVARGFAYFATDTTPGIVVKVRLSNFTRVDAVTLNAGEFGLFSAVIDSPAGFAYFGTDRSPGTVVKVRLSDFTRVDSLTLNTGENHPHSAVIDPAGGYAYFGTSTSPGVVVKVQLAGTTAPSSANLLLIASGAVLVVLFGVGVIYFRRHRPSISASKSQEPSVSSLVCSSCSLAR